MIVLFCAVLIIKHEKECAGIIKSQIVTMWNSSLSGHDTRILTKNLQHKKIALPYINCV